MSGYGVRQIAGRANHGATARRVLELATETSPRRELPSITRTAGSYDAAKTVPLLEVPAPTTALIFRA